jgi:2-keto-3-deoxy-L-rhamnonate aldolase RhmA
MFRVVAIALVAMAAFDLVCLDGKHVHAALAMFQHILR